MINTKNNGNTIVTVPEDYPRFAECDFVRSAMKVGSDIHRSLYNTSNGITPMMFKNNIPAIAGERGSYGNY